MFVYDTGELTNPRYIVNFPTKRHWRGKSRIEDVEAGLDALVAEIRARGIRSIAIPPLGAGLGGLPWPKVRALIEGAMAALPDVEVLLFEPKGAPPAKEMARTAERPNMTAGRAALVGLMNRYLAGLMDPFVSLLEVQKLMYFMQETGENLNLRFSKHHYGPYSENLRHVLNLIEGHFVAGYAEGGDRPDKQLELIPAAASEAESFLAAHSSTKQRFDRVADLVEGFETPFGMELLASVHWVAAHEDAISIDEFVERIHGWNDRKKRFAPDQIRIALDVLTDKGWLHTAA
jgi:O-acetyl-ADP-ribose deacetylase (regulator of RNase III)